MKLGDFRVIRMCFAFVNVYIACVMFFRGCTLAMNNAETKTSVLPGTVQP